MTMMKIAKKLYNTDYMLVIIIKAFHKVTYSNLRTALWNGHCDSFQLTDEETKNEEVNELAHGIQP